MRQDRTGSVVTSEKTGGVYRCGGRIWEHGLAEREQEAAQLDLQRSQVKSTACLAVIGAPEEHREAGEQGREWFRENSGGVG